MVNDDADGGGGPEPAARPAVRCFECGDTVVPEYPDTAEELAGESCSNCKDGRLAFTRVSTFTSEQVRDLLVDDELRVEALQEATRQGADYGSAKTGVERYREKLQERLDEEVRQG